MPVDERDQALLYDVLSAAQRLQMMWEGRAMNDLLGDRTLQWATDRGFNILGEAARRACDATKALYPGIVWRRIIGVRNFVVHDYDAVDHSRHWIVIQDDLPRVIVELKKASS